MQKINTQTIGKIAATVAGLSLVAMSVAAAVPAHAQTTTTTTSTTMSAAQVAAIQAQIASLEAQLSAATGGSSMSASVTFARNLTIGSTGADVTALQTWLIAKGYSIPAGATGYFGTETRAAVAAYQSANGITPAVGYFGPITRAKVNASAGSTSTTTTTTTTSPTTLTGGEGSVNNFEVLGSPSNVTLYQGQMAQVFGFQFKASGSDLDVQRVDIDLTNNGTVVNSGSGEDRPWDILQTATLYDGSTVIGTVDASNQNNWSQDGTETFNSVSHQTYRIEFGNLNDVVKNGAQANYYVAFTAQNGVSQANQTQYNAQLASQGVRAVDALGLQEYSSGTQSTSVAFSVSNSAAGTVIISTGSDNPSATTIVGNSTAATNNVTLGTFTIQSQNAATQLFELPVGLTVGTTTTSVIPVQSLALVENGTTLQSVAIPTGTTFLGPTNAASTTVIFNNLTNVVIPAGTTQEFQIQADINPISSTVSGDAGDGSSASVSVPSANSSGIDFEQGSNRVTPTGSMTGNIQTFRSFGLNATVTASAPVTSGQDTTSAAFTFTVPVTAFNQNVYVSSTSSAFSASIHTSSTTYSAAGVVSSNAPVDSASGNYVVYPGSTQTFTITVTALGAVGPGLNYAVLNSLHWGAVNTLPTANTFTFPSGSGNQSNAVNLNAS